MVAWIFGHSVARNRARSSFISAELAPGATNMPRPRRFSTSPSSASCW